MDPAQLQPGHRLDRYELLCPLAYGGMASVWLARFGGRGGFERLVVVKMILPQYSQDPRFQEMFLDEARIASRIEHANVARILDVGEQDESTFIVMEWVDGDSLSKVVRAAEQKKQRVPVGFALRVCADAAAGLHAAHVLKERDGTPLGVVHRDVSPQNILISNAGTTVIIDFGVAKARDRVSQDTSAGQLKGKIRYMAPEQALGRNVDHRADVWALGTILYELFAGVPPYDGPNEVATLHKLTSGQPPDPLPSHVVAPVRAVIERAIAYDPDARYATALELNLALEAAMVEIAEPTTAAAVALYTGQLLSDRKAARKRAVDTAVNAAHARDAERASAMPPPVARAASPVSRSMPLNTPRMMQPPTGGELASSVSDAPLGSMGLSEIPSAASSASSATLGSAAMEYPFPSPPPMSDEESRRRRLVTASVLGVSVAAGLIGVVLIISTAVLKPRAPKDLATGSTSGELAPNAAAEPPTANAGAPAPTSVPSPSAVTGTTTAAAAAPTAPPALEGTTPPAQPTRDGGSTLTLSNATAKAPAAAPAAPPIPTATAASPSTAPTNTPAKPPAFDPRPAPTPVRPRPTTGPAAPTSKGPDRGF